MEPRIIDLAPLLEELNTEIQAIAPQLDIAALARLLDLQGQRRGILRAVEHAQQRPRVGPAVPSAPPTPVYSNGEEEDR